MGAPGCDDAPIVHVPLGRRCKLVTFVYPYYDNPRFLARQVMRWENYPRSLAPYVSFIVVDDGSPTRPAESVLVQARLDRLRLFRVHEDRRWNWLTARNIGAHHADDDWLLLTDMDHAVDVTALRSMITGEHNPDFIYRFSRREANGTKIHPHPNSWFMTKRMFWKVGGYDEALSGYYGTDGEYRRRCAATAPIRICTVELERNEHFEDSSTSAYKRKQPEDAEAKRIIKSRGPEWRPRVLSFPYSEVDLHGEESERPHQATGPHSPPA